MEKTIKVIEADIKRDVFGRWEDCSPGLYFNSATFTEKVESVFCEYEGKKIKVTIEEVS